MNYEQALKLCILAHKGQYRRSILLTKPEDEEVSGIHPLPNKQEHNFNDGSKLIWDDLNEGYSLLVPYSSHPIAVAAMMNTEYRKVLALLHDVIEDTPCTLGLIDLNDGIKYYLANPDWHKHEEISYDLYTDLNLLTKDPNLTYSENIQRIADSKRMDPVAVKIGGNSHNLSTTDSDKQRQKYITTSLPILLAVV